LFKGASARGLSFDTLVCKCPRLECNTYFIEATSVIMMPQEGMEASSAIYMRCEYGWRDRKRLQRVLAPIWSEGSFPYHLQVIKDKVLLINIGIDYTGTTAVLTIRQLPTY
jgi:hypothetical protein